MNNLVNELQSAIEANEAEIAAIQGMDLRPETKKRLITDAQNRITALKNSIKTLKNGN